VDDLRQYAIGLRGITRMGTTWREAMRNSLLRLPIKYRRGSFACSEAHNRRLSTGEADNPGEHGPQESEGV
jgi:hypothetical protein